MNNDFTITKLVDDLGNIDKQIKALQIEEKKLKDEIKDLATLPDGKKTYVGQSYVVTITSRTNHAFDFKALETNTGLTKVALDAYKTIPSTSLIASVAAI